MKEVLGNTDGLKNNIIESLLQLYELKVPQGCFYRYL